MTKISTFKLDEIGFIGRGKSRHRPRNAPELYGGKYPFFQTGDVKSAELYLSKYSQTYNETGLRQSKLWPKGTLCITIAANIAETAILEIEGCFPDSVVGFIPNQEICDVRYIKYYIDMLKLKMKNASRGTTQDNLNLKKLLSFEFQLPPVDIQKTIADFLSSVDQKIDFLTNKIESLHTIGDNLFALHEINYMLAEPYKLTDFISFERGIEPGSRNYSKEQLPKTTNFIRVGNLSKRSDNIFVDDSLLQGKVLLKNDVVISMDGTPGIVRTGLEGGFSSAIQRCMSKNDSIGNACIYFLLRSKRVQDTIKAHSSGATILHASKSIKYMSLHIPADIINELSIHLSPIFNFLSEVYKQIERHRNLRYLLLVPLISNHIMFR